MIHEFQQKALDKAAARKQRKAEYDRSAAPAQVSGANCVSKMRKRAAAHGWGFDLDVEWVSDKLAKTHCEATGLPFEGSRKDSFGRTIDRKDSSKGYTKDNCWVVCWIYNRCKLDGTHEDVIRMARALTNTQ